MLGACLEMAPRLGVDPPMVMEFAGRGDEDAPFDNVGEGANPKPARVGVDNDWG